jgi:predicted RecB family endonuclease
MKKLYYEKIGRKYVLVKEYDSEFLDAYPKGNHLIMSYPGGSSRRYNIDPNYAAMIAAGRVAKDAVCQALIKASALKPVKQLLTERQKKAWKELADALSDDLGTLQSPSVNDIAEAGINAMMLEAEKLLKHEAVKQAFDHFITISRLCAEDNTNDH